MTMAAINSTRASVITVKIDDVQYTHVMPKDKTGPGAGSCFEGSGCTESGNGIDYAV